MKRLFLILIILLAAFLRLYDLPRADVITDEALIGFRSIGYLDFFLSPYQTTPLEWFDGDIPSWTKFSFHDHPPLTFIIQHFSLRVFGVNEWGQRLPFALAGIASVWLVYLIGRRLFASEQGDSGGNRDNQGECIGLLAAGLIAVNSYHVWISRIGLQESLVILFSLCAVLFCLKFLNEPRKYWWRLGLALGACFLTKYTTFILVPALIAVGWYWFHGTRDERGRPLQKRFFFRYGILAGMLAVFIFSPVLVYNIKLFQVRGHFDLQFSYFFGQAVPGWETLPGKIMRGIFSERIARLLPTLRDGLSPAMFWLFTGSVVLFIVDRVKRITSLGVRNGMSIVLIVFGFYGASFLFLGVTPWFAAVAVPWVVLAVAVMGFSCVKTRGVVRDVAIFSASRRRDPNALPPAKIATSLTHDVMTLHWLKKKNIRAYIFLLYCLFFLLFEIFFTWNTIFTVRPWPQDQSRPIDQVREWRGSGLTWSPLKVESFQWGYHELGTWIDGVLRDRRPALTFPSRYQFLTDIQHARLAEARKEGREALPVMFVYDENMNGMALLWYLFRYTIYDGWPMLSSAVYLQTLESEGSGYFKQQGITQVYFIRATDRVLQNGADERVDAPQRLEVPLINSSMDHIQSISNAWGEEVFRVYEM